MQKSIAVLIDADNVHASYCTDILQKCKEQGTIIINRAYGDFTNGTAMSWKKCLSEKGISPRQTFAVSANKNAADIALTVDAMDIFHQNPIDIFCLVSSDSDFTPLATRLREQAIFVQGFGEEKTPNSFRKACNKFTILPAICSKQRAVIHSITKHADHNGWIDASSLGSKVKADFPEEKICHLKKLLQKMEQTNQVQIDIDKKTLKVRIT